MHIRAYETSDEEAVIALWTESGLVRPWNDPRRDIARKLTTQREMFLVAVDEDTLVGTAMVGYDGHRGWVYYLAVALACRRQAIGKTLMAQAEAMLIERGCPKINLLVRTTNTEVIDFYAKLGYVQDQAVSLGRRLIPDV